MHVHPTSYCINLQKPISAQISTILLINPHQHQLTTTYQFNLPIHQSLTEDLLVDGTLVFDKLHIVPIYFMVELHNDATSEVAPNSRFHGFANWRLLVTHIFILITSLNYS